MHKPSEEELNESIKELSSYKERLTQEVINISQKLRMSKDQITSTLKDHPELNFINETIQKLQSQLEEYSSQN